MTPRPTACLAVVAVTLLAAACGSSGGPQARPSFAGASSTSGASASGSPEASTDPQSALPALAVGATLVDGLSIPWGMVLTGSGDLLFSERGTARISKRSPDGAVTDLGKVPGVQPAGEGGLLGLELSDDEKTLFAYRTTADDNDVVRMDFDGASFGEPEVILSGIPKNSFHNGGRLAIGPDGLLYVSTGDAGDRSSPQDTDSLGGKILRIGLDGSIPADNPFGNAVWTYGHRNVQGLDWDSADRMWSSELGQNTDDEMNLIVKGGNYGWPLLEGNREFSGNADGKDLVAPQVTWPTDQASPSGLTIVDDVAYVMALRGQRIWQVPLVDGTAGEPRSMIAGELGRVRTAVPSPDGKGLWVATANGDDDTITSVTFG